ncbi:MULTISPECIES: MsnO8 family LLM class oxidoreductase [unclassified Cryobacterium]|uniref:MsnO8 family LLM class oxidoreductase n=1 Tax=unclassified Cryobacterium TaxID=2649013 RepID=UPI0010694124|nr:MULTISPECIES: MsnO8 family LLM class oxidoreductase [unclassified Cryobacterium]TFD08968.1 MsnO8 family LLM class oxidoreductase [Cryobacterium sp. TMT1-2-2]TFD10790.1 MsnO8 family LLM class oxidoreductase [Cryobacterium sp. TMT1-66-1]
MVRLSILDQSPIAEGTTAAAAIRDTVRLGTVAAELGYERFWVAEHHDSPSFAGTAPEILALALLENTSGIRIGTGGVLLARYTPAKVAETFNILAALHPGRVDLGIGRAGDRDGSYPAKVVELHERLGLLPHDPERTDLRLWMLGAGRSTAPVAGAIGSGYAHAHFLNQESAQAALHAYRDSFLATVHRPEPEPLLAVRVITAEHSSVVSGLREIALLWRSRKDLGDDSPFPAMNVSLAHRWSGHETTRRAANQSSIISGTPQDVRRQLEDLARLHGIDEIMVNSPIAGYADREASYALLAEAFALVRK